MQLFENMFNLVSKFWDLCLLERSLLSCPLSRGI